MTIDEQVKIIRRGIVDLVSEEDLRGWLGVVSSQIRELDKKMESLRVEVQAKGSEAHARLHSRINDVDDAVCEIKQTLARIEPTVEAAKKHLETDVSFEDGQNKALAGGAKWVVAAALGAFISWLVSKFGGAGQ